MVVADISVGSNFSDLLIFHHRMFLDIGLKLPTSPLKNQKKRLKTIRKFQRYLAAVSGTKKPNMIVFQLQNFKMIIYLEKAALAVAGSVGVKMVFS